MVLGREGVRCEDVRCEYLNVTIFYVYLILRFC